MKKFHVVCLLLFIHVLRSASCCMAAASTKHGKTSTASNQSVTSVPRLASTTGQLTTGSYVSQATNELNNTDNKSYPTGGASSSTKSSLGVNPTLASAPSNASGFTNSSKKEGLDACTKWEKCGAHNHPLVQSWLRALPGCPCTYPRYLYLSDRSRIYDPVQKSAFRWHRVNNKFEKLHVYKQHAKFCIRQALTSHSTAVQQCCYDHHLRLITRGSGAGTPNLVSRDVAIVAHDKVDLMPWRICRGDWTRYHNVRPPNNALNCTQNPRDHQFAMQMKKAMEY